MWLPVLVVPQILLTAGLCWFLAALGVFVRDLAQINGFLLTLWFFLTPICYPETSLPALGAARFSRRIRCSFWCAAIATRCSRAARRRFGSLWKLYVVSGVIFILGHAWFYKLRKSFADLI